MWRFSYDFHETINWLAIKRWSIQSLRVYWNVFDSKSLSFTILFKDVNVLIVIFLLNCKMHLQLQMTRDGSQRQRRISVVKIYKSEKNIKKNPGAYISFFPPLHAVVYFNILLLCAWMALLIEFIFMINVFFFPSPSMLLCYSAFFFIFSSKFFSFTRSPFISYLFIICFTFFSLHRHRLLLSFASFVAATMKMKSSRMNFFLWIIQQKSFFFWWKWSKRRR